jgi:hypothetical protein
MKTLRLALLLLALIGAVMIQAAHAGQAQTGVTFKVVTLADNVQVPASEGIELGPVDVSAYDSIAFLGSTGGQGQFEFFFTSESAPLSSGAPALRVGVCYLRLGYIESCSGSGGGTNSPDFVFRVAGPYVVVRVPPGLPSFTMTLKMTLRPR